VGLKREHPGDIWRRPDGTYYFAEDTAVIFANECMVIRSDVDTRRSPLDVRVGTVHPHPTNWYLPVYGCPADNGVLYQRGPWDTTATNRVPITKQPETQLNGGASPRDWFYFGSRPENTNPDTAPTVSNYIITEFGDIWKIDASVLRDPSSLNRSIHSYRFRGNTPATGRPYSCNW
jgi:hypothetical protein